MPKTEAVRPTGGRAREAVFNILSHFAFGDKSNVVLDAAVLDLFCGSGAMGFEALSRGASKAMMIDVDSAAISAARKSAVKLGEFDNAIFQQADCSGLPKARAKYNLVFIDPPYGKGLVKPCLEKLISGGWLEDGAIIVVEQGEKEKLPEVQGYKLLDERRYGVSKVTLLQAGAEF